MSKFNLVTIRPTGFLHSSASQDVKDSLAWSLTSLGHEVICSEQTFARGSVTNIIFCSELIPPGTPIPTDAIIYNLEQPSHPHMGNMRVLAQNHTIWDYSKDNVEDWISRGFTAHHLPIGYTPNLTRIPQATHQDIDIFFVGWLTPRRVKIIDQLKASGLKVYASDCCYGGSRDQILSRTKLCLNINHDGRDRFNIVRVSYLLANQKLVLSETSADTEPWQVQSCAWAEYDNLVDTCKTLLQSDSESERLRHDQAEFGHEIFSQQDFTESVARVLSPSPQSSSSVHSLLTTRYELGLKHGDMIDFMVWLRRHAQGAILEIGTRDGASTSAFLLGLETNDPAGTLTSIDITDCSYLWSHPQWKFIHGNSLQAQFPDSTFDLVLIDGDHSQAAYRGDLYNAYYWTKPGGMIVTHDLIPERGHEFYAVGIREEFDKFLRLHPELKHFILPGKYGMGVMQKP